MLGSLFHFFQKNSLRTPSLGLLLGVYCFCLPFSNLLYLLGAEERFQLTELLFIPLCIYYFKKSNRTLVKELFLAFLFIVPYILVNLTSAIIAQSFSSTIEVFGKIYLVLLGGICADFILKNSYQGVHYLFNSWKYGFYISVIIGLIGFLFASYLKINNGTVLFSPDYPYFGDTYRIKSLSESPTLFVLVGLIPILFSFYQRNKPQLESYFLGLLFFIILLTFSKEILFLVCGLMLIYFNKNQWNSSFSIIVFFLFFTISNLLTNTLISLPGKNDGQESITNNYRPQVPLGQIGGLQFEGSTYFLLKTVAFQIGLSNFWWGIGPGQFNSKLDKLKKERKFPVFIPNYDPHSTWFGAFAETGILGFFSNLSIFILLLYRFYKSTIKNFYREDQLLFVLLSLLLLTSFNTDIMNFRFLWVLIGISIGLILNKNKNNLQSDYT